MRKLSLCALLLAVLALFDFQPAVAQTPSPYPGAPTVAIARYYDWSLTPRPLQGVVIFNADGTIATFSGGGGGGGAVTAAANSYATGYSPDLGKIADVAYTDTTGAASGGLVAINKGQYVKLDAIRAILAGTLTISGTVTQSNAVARDTAGAAIAPIAGTANRIVTKTSLTASTSTTVCPAQTSPAPVTTEVIALSGSLGLGVNGQTLTTASVGASTSAPDVPMPNANTYYLFPVAPTNAITAYSGTAQVVTCIQTTRQ